MDTEKGTGAGKTNVADPVERHRLEGVYTRLREKLLDLTKRRYHSSKSARDRDRLREQVLGDLGWDVLRVWSTDWFENPDGETDKLIKKLEQLRTRPSRGFQEYVIGGLAMKRASLDSPRVERSSPSGLPSDPEQPTLN